MPQTRSDSSDSQISTELFVEWTKAELVMDFVVFLFVFFLFVLETNFE